MDANPRGYATRWSIELAADDGTLVAHKKLTRKSAMPWRYRLGLGRSVWTSVILDSGRVLPRPQSARRGQCEGIPPDHRHP